MRKTTLRLCALLLVLCLLCGALSGCWRAPAPVPVPTTPVGGGGAAAPAVSDLAYTLTQADVDAVYAAIEDCERLFLDLGPTEWQMQQALDELEDRFAHLSTQAALAYIYYCLDQTGGQASQDYLFATAAQTECYGRYAEMCRRIDESSSVGREFFFRDWTEEEREEILGYSDGMAAISQENNELLVEYRALDDAEFMDGAARCYLRLLQNNNRLAELSGYANYWEYAYDQYQRDYGAAELEVMREYIRTYLPPLLNQVISRFGDVTSRMTESEYMALGNLLGMDYDLVEGDYLEGYTASYSRDVHEAMQSLFGPENSFFTDSDSAYAGAFTVTLAEPGRPVCYFGPGYQELYTVVHEMGHYYAALVNPEASAVLDLAEVHSQGNEWLLTAWFQDELPGLVAEAMFLNQLGGALISVILCTAVDDFEQRCYTEAPDSVAELDALADAVVDDYGGDAWFTGMITDFPVYWRMVALESPGYYISYAVSMLASLQLYCVTQEQSFAAGQQVYLDLVETDPGTAFTETLRQVGLDSPLTDASVYEDICRLLE